MRLLRQELMFWMVMAVGAVAAFCFVPPEWPAAIGATQFQVALFGAVLAAFLARGPLAAAMGGNEEGFLSFDGGGDSGDGGDGGGDGGGD